MINFGGPRMWLGLVALGISSLSYLRLLVRQDHSGARTAARLGFTGVTLASMSLIRRNSAFFKG